MGWANQVDDPLRIFKPIDGPQFCSRYAETRRRVREPDVRGAGNSRPSADTGPLDHRQHRLGKMGEAALGAPIEFRERR